ncbi:MAG: BrnT family toxin [Chloroflexota bacterium]|nr:BrnT family toxin [Chloroflexota bacterium]MDE2684891.1 BrnT family toxin [Chloroflexota bacterium]MYC32900.1 BrnT family toxin [Chloroflexota bacterium]
MIDFSRVADFQWDDGNARKNSDLHDVSQSEAEQVFFNRPLLIVDDTAHSQQERRQNAFGITTAGRRLHVTFTMRNEGTLIRIISARDMSRRERERYGEET